MLKKQSLLYLVLLFSSTVFASKADSLLVLIDRTEAPLEKADMLLKVGDTFGRSNPDSAIYYYNKAYEMASSASMSSSKKSLSPEADLLRAQSLRYIGIVYSERGNYEKALTYYFDSKAILDNIKEMYTSPFRDKILQSTAKIFNNVGIVYDSQGAYSVAKDYYQQALALQLEVKDSISIANAYNSMGVAEARLANLTEALTYFQKAIDIYVIINNKDNMAATFNNVAGIHFQMKNWDAALELFHKALKIFEEINYHLKVASVKSNIGLVYQNLEDYDNALKMMNESLELRQMINNQSGIIESYYNIGGIYSLLGEHTKANKLYNEAHGLAVETGNQRMIALTLINIGKEHFAASQPSLAISSTLKALETAKSSGLKITQQEALKKLGEYYAAIGDYKKGFEYSTAHFALSQEILDEQKARQINELEIEHKARENKQKIEFLEHEQQYNRVQLRQSKTIMVVLGLLFITGIITTLFVFLLLRQRNRILVLKKEKEAKMVIRQTDNNLQAILKTHAHGMILFDNDLSVLSFNTKAELWFSKYMGLSLKHTDTLDSNRNLLLKELSKEIMLEAMKGYSRECEKEIVHDNTRHHFKFFCNPVFEDDDDVIQSVSLMIEDVTEIRNNEERILSDLKEKETLIKEIHHRVKNNLQVIISLIRMQSRQFKEAKLLAAFNDLEQRIATMSYIHEDLYRSPDMASIKLNDYIGKLAATLSNLYNNKAKVYHHIDLKNDYISIDMAMPCGMLVNELVSNSLKHAFVNTNGNSAQNRVDIYIIENPMNYEIRISDNGAGMQEGINPQRPMTMGFHLVKVIVEDQLYGNWNIHSNAGVKVSVVFPKEKPGMS